MAVNLKVTRPEVKVDGLWSAMEVAVLSHWIELAGTGEKRGVGLTVTVTVLDGPSLQPVGLTGVTT